MTAPRKSANLTWAKRTVCRTFSETRVGLPGSLVVTRSAVVGRDRLRLAVEPYGSSVRDDPLRSSVTEGHAHAHHRVCVVGRYRADDDITLRRSKATMLLLGRNRFITARRRSRYQNPDGCGEKTAFSKGPNLPPRPHPTTTPTSLTCRGQPHGLARLVVSRHRRINRTAPSRNARRGRSNWHCYLEGVGSRSAVPTRAVRRAGHRLTPLYGPPCYPMSTKTRSEL